VSCCLGTLKSVTLTVGRARTLPTSDVETPSASERTTSIDSVPSPKVSLITGDGEECEYSLIRYLISTFNAI
jgi:hypothetical protein